MKSLVKWFRDTLTPRNHASSSQRPKKRTLLQLEQLEDRVVPVVGATAIPVSIGHGFDTMTNQMSHYEAGYSGGVYLYSWKFYSGYHVEEIGTGSLLAGGQHILTAAHLITDNTGHYSPKDYTVVVIETANGAIGFDVPAANYHIHPGYDGKWEEGSDLAILTLPTAAVEKIPYGTYLYDIYANNDEVGQVFTMVGYGDTGTGNTGEIAHSTGAKLKGQNRFDITSDVLVHHTPNGLAYDFDSGNQDDDTLGAQAGIVDLGLGGNEAFQGNGDSGGPLFVGGAIAGVVSYSYGYTETAKNSGFGAVGVVTRLSAPANADWINGFIAPLIHRTSGRSYTLDLTGKADGNTDTVELRTFATTVDFYVNGKDVHSEYLWGLNSITIKGSGDATNYTIPAALKDRIHLNGGVGANTLALDDRGYFKAQTLPAYTVTNAGIWRDGVSLLPADFSGIQAMTLRTSAGGGDVTVNGFPIGMPIVLEGSAGNDTFRLGGDLNSLSSLGSKLTVHGNGGNDTLILNDTAASPYFYNGTPTYTISPFSVVRTQQVRFSFARPEVTQTVEVDFNDIDHVTLNGSNIGSRYNVESTYAATAWTINGGRGDDIVTIGGVNDVSSVGAFAFNGGAGNDALILDDRTITDFPFPGGIVRPNVQFAITYHDVHYTDQADIVSADTGEVQGSFGTFKTVIEYGNDVENLHILAGSRPDIFNVESTSANTAVTIEGGDGDDILTVGDDDASVGGIAGALNFIGGAGNDALVLDDRVIADFPFGDQVVRPNVLFTITDQEVRYRDRVDIVSADGTVQGNFGTFDATIGYGNDVESLLIMGGSRPDLFTIMSTSAATPVAIDGGGGEDTLDYSNYQTGVTVDLAAGVATDLARAVNFENVIGGSGNDWLSGDDGDNMLMGGAGDDFLDGRGARNVLFGGLGADSLIGGSDDDLLVGGSTVHDLDDAALKAIAAEWLRRDADFQERINHLMGVADGGLNGATLLTAGTVSDDGAVDTFTGAGGQNWLIAGQEDVAALDERIAQLENQRQAQQDRLDAMQSDNDAHSATLLADLDQAAIELAAAQADSQNAVAQIDDLDQNQIPAARQALTDAENIRAAAQANLDNAQASYDAAYQKAQATPAALQRQQLSSAELNKQLAQAKAAYKPAEASFHSADAKYVQASKALAANKNPKKTTTLKQARDSAKKARDQAELVYKQKNAQLDLAQNAYDLKLARRDLNNAKAAFEPADRACMEAAKALASLQSARDMADANRQAADQRAVDLQARIDQDNAELADPQAALTAAQADLDATMNSLTQAQQDRQTLLAL